MFIEKVTRMALLYDFYGQLLTAKQGQLFRIYYDDNLTLGEIAEEFGITRQAVHDLLKRTEKTLEEYEAKLGLVAKHLEERRYLAQLSQTIREYRQVKDDKLLDQMDKILASLLDVTK